MMPGLNLRTWEKAAFRRRLLLLFLSSASTAVAGGFMGVMLLRRGNFGLELFLFILFVVLFAWISIGFWGCVFGFITLVRRRDRFSVTGDPDAEDAPPAPEARTAILIPVCDEEVDRVFAGLFATYQSLRQTGRLENFDFFVLSDTRSPDTWVEEEAAWAELCRTLETADRIFYRHRRVNLKRKSGNVADFCRRWGRNYRYMIVFDADSIMTGPTLVRMVRLMEKHPTIGILQTAPLTVNRETLFARMQQFANHVYGPLFAAGLHFWQLGDAQFWGHNAIIRVAPFMRHCALPRLPGKPPLGGDILSHDFVEADADAAGGLGGLAGVRPGRKLRGDAAHPAGGTETRPALVPGEPAAPAAAVHPGILPRPSGSFSERRHVLPLGPVLVPLSQRQHRRGGNGGLCQSGLFPNEIQSFPPLAGVEAGMGADPAGLHRRHSLPAQIARRRSRPRPPEAGRPSAAAGSCSWGLRRVDFFHPFCTDTDDLPQQIRVLDAARSAGRLGKTIPERPGDGMAGSTKFPRGGIEPRVFLGRGRCF